MHDQDQKQAIETFVRNELGCTCPEEVFQHIHVETSPRDFADFSVYTLITLGGRLMVAILELLPLNEILDQLEPICDRGRRLRDARGFNRFRLVATARNVAGTEKALHDKFNAAIDGDDHVHLHVVQPDLVSFLHPPK